MFRKSVHKFKYIYMVKNDKDKYSAHYRVIRLFYRIVKLIKKIKLKY